MGDPHQKNVVSVVFRQSFPTLAAALLVLFAAFLRSRHIHALGGYSFWDAHVYTRTFAAFNAGQPTYTLRQQLDPGFLNPPWLLRAGAALTRILPAALGLPAYLGSSVLATLAVPCLFARGWTHSRWLTPAFALLLFAAEPKWTGIETLLGGNLACLLYAALLLAAIPGLRKNLWSPFLVTLLLAAAVKPQSLTLLLIPLFLGTRQLWPSTLTAASALLIDILQRLTLPSLYAQYTAALHHVYISQDWGFSLLWFVSLLAQHSPAYPRAATAVLVLAILLPALAITHRLSALAAIRTNPLWPPAVLLLSLLCSIRLEVYDASLAILAATYLTVECLRQARLNTLTILCTAVPTLLIAFALRRPDCIYVPIFLLAALAASLYRLTRNQHLYP